MMLPVVAPERGPDFEAHLEDAGLGALTRGPLRTLQVNVGKLCNQACLHCHVEAGPKRTEQMTAEVAGRIIELLEATPNIDVMDLTGGAPELNANFRRLVIESRRHGVDVIDRCNLTVLFEPGMETLPRFLADHQVRVTASLPCYTSENVDQQRGRGAFDKSINALQLLNELGYGAPGSGLALDLVYNPLGAFLPPPQASLERTYKRELREAFGIEFNSLLTLTNLPISRFEEHLRKRGEYQRYMELLLDNFNPETVGGLMCRSLVSIGYDGTLYDCDFNQMLEIGIAAPSARTIWDVEDLSGLRDERVATGSHCFGCTAGAGSSCGGALARGRS